MKTIELTITQEDLEKAQAHDSAGKSVVCGCLVWQAMHRCGLKPDTVGFYTASTEGKIENMKLCRSGIKITASMADKWPKFVGATFTLTETL